jgi:hypothetical protein
MPVVPEWIAGQIRADAAASRFARRGRSPVSDYTTGEPVLPRKLFDELHELAGVTGSDTSDAGIGVARPIGSAGLLHVYGYLLSTGDTEHGPKRDRCTHGEWRAPLGCPTTRSLRGSQPRRRPTRLR